MRAAACSRASLPCVLLIHLNYGVAVGDGLDEGQGGYRKDVHSESCNCEMNHGIQRLPLDGLDLLTCSLDIQFKAYSAKDDVMWAEPVSEHPPQASW